MPLTNTLGTIISYSNKMLKNMDVVLCAGILFTGLAIIYLSYVLGIGQYGMGLAFLLGPITYYFLKKSAGFKIARGESTNNNKMNLTSFLTTNIVYLICFTLSVIILRNTLYIRPSIYFIIVAIAFFSLFIEIFNGKKEGVQIYFIIAKTVLLSLSFREGRFFSYPTIPGADTHFHLLFVKSIIMEGHIYGYEQASQYLYAPLWHIFETINGIITSLNLADMLFYSIAVTFTIILSLFIFLVAKKMFNVRVGLIALLFVNVADMLFVRGVTSIYTSSFVHIFLIMTLFCLIQHKNRPIYSFFILLFILCSVLTHQLSTFSFFIIIFALLIGKHLYLLILNDYSSGNKNLENISLNINNNTVLYFFTIMIFYWSTMGPAVGNTFFDKMVSRLNGTLTRMFNEYTSQGHAPATTYENLFSQFDIISNILYNFGYSILMGLAVVGLLILLNRNYRSETSFSYIWAAIMLFAIIYPGTLIGLNQVFIPHRFISLLELFLVIFAAFSVYILYTSSSKKYGKLGIAVVTMFLIFFMITTPFINRNDAIYCTERIYKTGYTYSELTAIEWANDHMTDGKLIVDPLVYSRPLSTVEELNVSDVQIMHYPISLDQVDISHNVLVRQYIKDKPNVIIGGTFGDIKKTDFGTFIENLPEKCNHIYSINSASVYRKK